MGEAGVGAKIYEFYKTGKAEEFLDNYRNFDWTENEDPEDWGHQGIYSLNFINRVTSNKRQLIFAKLGSNKGMFESYLFVNLAFLS